VAAASAPAFAAPTATLVPCTTTKDVAKPPEGTQCLTVPVPLDHSGAVAGTVRLALARVPAIRTTAGTLVILAGGPGQAAVPLAGIGDTRRRKG
jgi:hypothetical protein